MLGLPQWYQRQHRFVRTPARVASTPFQLLVHDKRGWCALDCSQTVHESGARGLVEVARSRMLQRMAGQAKPPAATVATAALHANARLLPGIAGRVDEHTVRLYEIAAEQGSAYAAMRAGDAAFYGGLGTGGRPATESSLRSTSRAAQFYNMAAAIELEEEAAAAAAGPDDGPAKSEGGGDAHDPEPVPSVALSEKAKPGPRVIGWQGAYHAAYMHEAEGDLQAAVRAYTGIIERTNFAPRPLVAVVVAVHRCAARALVGMPVFEAVRPVAVAARKLRQAVFGV